MLLNMSTSLMRLIARVISFDVSAAADPAPINVLKSYDETATTTLFLFPLWKKNVIVLISFLFMVFVFSFRMIFIPFQF